MHPVRAVVHASPLTPLTVAGLSVVARTVLTLASAGVRTITVVREDLAPEALATAQTEVASRLGDTTISWIGPDDADPHAQAGTRVVTARINGIFRGSLVSRLLARGRMGNVFMAFACADAGLLMLSAPDHAALTRGEDVPYDLLQARTDDYHPVLSDKDVDAAERALFSWCIKETDGLVSRTLNRPISTRISRHLSHLDIAPRQLTAVTAALALATFACLIIGTPLGLIAGCVLYHVTSVVDGLDGEVARAKFMSSKSGAALDTGVDMASNLLFMIGVSVGCARVFGSTYLWMGAFTAATAIAAIATMVMALRFGPGGGSFDVLQLTIQRRLAAWPRFRHGFLYLNALFKRDFFAFGFAALGVTGREGWIPGILAFGTAAWLLTILLNVPAILRANREDVLPPHLRTQSVADT